MRYVQVTNGVVTNATNFAGPMPSDWDSTGSWLQSDTAHIGWTYSGGTFTPPPPNVDPAPTPEQARQAAINANARRKAFVTALQSSDDAQLIAYITSRVTDLPTARTALIDLALLVAGVIRG